MRTAVARNTCPGQKCKKLTGSEHFLTFRCRFAWQAQGVVNLAKSERDVEFCGSFNYNYNYNTLHYTASLHSTTTTTLHYTILYYKNYFTLHSTTLHSITPQLHCTTLRCIALHCTQLHYATLHLQLQAQPPLQLRYVTLNYTRLHYVTLPYITLHYAQYTSTIQLHMHYIHKLQYTAITTPLHHNYSYSCTTPHYIQQCG